MVVTMAMEGDAHTSPDTKGRNIVVLLTMLVSVFLFLPCATVVEDRNPSVPCTGHGWLSDGLQETFPGLLELENACPDSEAFCFPSTLVSFVEVSDGLKMDDWSSDPPGVSFCEGPPLFNSRNLDLDGFDLGPPLLPTYLEITPSSLNWGMSSLLSPALVYFSMKNSHNSSMLHVFEPFSTDKQFYAYSFHELSLAPGEAASIAVVFLPRFLGSISGQIVLQTNFGGFVVQCKGIGVESPYGVEPFRGFDVSLDGRLTWKLSLYNPFDDGLYVDEVSAQVSVYSEHTSLSDNSTCSIEAFYQPSHQFGSFCKAGGRTPSWVDNRPHRQREVPPQNTETIVKVNLWPPIKGKVSGAICMKLWNSTRDKSDTIIVPLEVEVDGRANYNSLSGSVSVFFESLVPWNGRKMVCSLSLRNSASDLLSLIHIAESSKAFEVKYTKGLLLYPGSITQVALISYTSPIGSVDSPTEIPWESFNCKLFVVNNDSVSPQIIIPCQELVHACHRIEDIGGLEGSYIGVRFQEKKKLANARTGSLEGFTEESLPLKSKLTELLEADRVILRNWKSQGTMSKASVLKDHELLFPVVQIGGQFSKWITVHNPSENPVIMQFLLNSGTIIDQCKYPDDSSNPFLVNISRRETQDGFSLPESATTEAFVQPFGTAQFGPVLFQPSSQCIWSSSALIRNNLSGIEWLPLRAFGGSYSLLLLEGSKPVNKLEFNLPLPLSLNLSAQYSFFNLKTTSKSCDRQLYKELFAKNAGELPLEVTNLEVSGTNCGMDGFMIHGCKGFSLEPGESVRLLISYQPDFSAALVLRNLNLIMFSGVLSIPMEATLPVSLINLCKKSLFWTAIWKLFAPMFTAVSIVCLLLFILLHPTSGSEGYSIKSETTIATISKVQKPSHIHRNARNARSNKKDEKSEEGVQVSRCSRTEICVQENAQKMKENKDSGEQNKTSSQSPHSTKIPDRVPDSSNTSEAQQSSNLTVRVVKERGRRRKRRAPGGGLASKLEVSSSQSGNSTPSSPMSPNAFTQNSSYSSFSGVLEEQKQQNKQNFSLPIETTVQEPQKNSGKSVLLTAATFPTSGLHALGSSTSNFLASASPIAPYARAPGSKLSREETVKIEEDDVFGKDFTYDIWGNHFHLMGKPKDFSPKVLDEGDSQSFFARDPQSLMMMSSAHSVSPGEGNGKTARDWYLA